ncbi:MAG TPA: phosphoribosyltransferase family protein, partial [Candidatus Obscuribacterales bacterium]
MFKNRLEAGLRLAARLQEIQEGQEGWHGTEMVAIGLPRGGVPVASVVAQVLGCPLDILCSKKIPAPQNPEVALGAVSSGGTVIIEQSWARFMSADKEYIDAQVQRLTLETRKREHELLMNAGICERPSVANKTAIIVDDGIATGMTSLAALKDVKARNPKALVLATPVIAEDTYFQLLRECDMLVALETPRDFVA